MKCNICGRFDIPLYRQNVKGVKGVFHCEVHNLKTIDSSVRELVDFVSGKGCR